MRWIIIIIIILLVSGIAYAQDCIPLTNSMEISADTLLCTDNYSISQGITITAGSTLDCNNAIISGTGTGTGITISADNSVIANCNIAEFENGIGIINSENTSIINSSLSENKVGISMLNSGSAILINNIYHNNLRDISNITNILEEQTVEPEQEQIETEIIVEQMQNSTDIYNELKDRFSEYFDISEQNIKVERTFINNPDNTTTIKLVITPVITAFNYSYYEKIPKCMALYVKEIVFMDTNYKIIVDDPVIMWNFNELSGPEEISYRVSMIDDDCRNLLEGFGFATGFHQPEEPAKKLPVFIALILTISIIIIIILIKRIEQ